VRPTSWAVHRREGVTSGFQVDHPAPVSPAVEVLGSGSRNGADARMSAAPPVAFVRPICSVFGAAVRHGGSFAADRETRRRKARAA